MSNWRPISLIDMDLKIGSKAIAKRLKKIRPCVIHHNQCAYVKGRTTFDAVRTIENVMDFTERCHVDGRVICIDFQKAFDIVSREIQFLFRTFYEECLNCFAKCSAANYDCIQTAHTVESVSNYFMEQ